MSNPSIKAKAELLAKEMEEMQASPKLQEGEGHCRAVGGYNGQPEAAAAGEGLCRADGSDGNVAGEANGGASGRPEDAGEGEGFCQRDGNYDGRPEDSGAGAGLRRAPQGDDV